MFTHSMRPFLCLFCVIYEFYAKFETQTFNFTPNLKMQYKKGRTIRCVLSCILSISPYLPSSPV